MFSGHIGIDVLWLLFIKFIWKNIFEHSSKFATKIILNVGLKWYKCYFESVISLFLKVLYDFSPYLFLPLNISTQKSSKNLLCCQRLNKGCLVLVGSSRTGIVQC